MNKSVLFSVLCAAAVFSVHRVTAGVLPEPGFPQCAGVQLKGDTCDDATLEDVAKIGFRIVRRGFHWNAVEKEKGVYDFSKFDPQMKKCKALGLTVIVCLFGNNALYEDSPKAVTTEAGRKGYAAFAAETAKHYAGQPVIFEIWNEPNVQTFWRKGQHNSPEFAKEYSDLVNEAVPAILKAVPDAFVVAGSVSNYWEPSYEWTESCFRNGVLKSGIRGWSVHPYGVKTPEEFKVGHDRTKELLKKYGAPDLPIVDTERGFTVQKNTDITIEGWSGGDAAKASDYQSWHIVRQFLVDQIEGIRLTSWYELKGSEGFALYEGGKPRPALLAIKELLAELSGYRFEKLVRTECPEDRLAIFVNKEGARKLVAWTAAKPGASPDETAFHAVLAKTDAAKGTGYGLYLTGAPQYRTLPAGTDVLEAVNVGPVRSLATVAVAAQPAALPASAAKLDLVSASAGWKFIPNTGKGSVTVGKASDGRDAVLIDWDFSQSKSKSVPYVMTTVPVAIDAAGALAFLAKSPIAQNLTVRVSDSTGQTLQSRVRIKGTGNWEAMAIRLDKKMEHWDGANDGFVHFPVKSICVNVPKPGETMSGRVELCDFATAAGAPAKQSAAKPAKQPKPEKVGKKAAEAAPLGEAKDLALFGGSAQWKFIKNTGTGDMRAADGVGTLEYDFSKSKAKGVPYVLATVPVDIAAGSAIVYKVRTSVPGQKLTMRVTDATDQTLQFKTKLQGAGEWETVKFPLDRKLEHWGGENDGFTHYPVKNFCLSVPKTGDVASGKLEFSEAVVK